MLNNSFVVYTLIDVTESKHTTAKGTSMKYKQYQNYNSFLQALSLRTQLFSLNVTSNENCELTDYKFGSDYKNENVWKLMFEIETPDVWKKENDTLHHAHLDLHGVPVYSGLNESILFQNVIDCLSNSTRNTYVEKIDIT
jgi:hypothetical protein